MECMRPNAWPISCVATWTRSVSQTPATQTGTAGDYFASFTRCTSGGVIERGAFLPAKAHVSQDPVLVVIEVDLSSLWKEGMGQFSRDAVETMVQVGLEAVGVVDGVESCQGRKTKRSAPARAAPFRNDGDFPSLFIPLRPPICGRSRTFTFPAGGRSPILMSASSSAGTSLKLNGETSLHRAKALAIPRRVSLAFIRFVGNESSLHGDKRTVQLKTGLPWKTSPRPRPPRKRRRRKSSGIANQR